MQVVGYDELDRPIVSTPSGLEKLDIEEVLRHRYLGVFGDAPGDHLLGGSGDITFGGNGGEIGERWRRIKVREKPREARLWQDAYHEIGRICSWLGLPTYVREEMTRIYANLRAAQKTMRVKTEKQLAKIAYLACMIHRIPRGRSDIERDIKEFYGHGIGKIPKGFIKAANYRHIRFRAKREKNGIEYLRRYALTPDGKMVNETVLSKL